MGPVLLTSLFSGPFILEVAYNETSLDLFIRWEQQSNVTMHSLQLFTCNDSMLMETAVSSSCSVFQLSGVDLTEYGLLLIAIQNCPVNGCAPAGVNMKNVVAIDFNNTGM